MMTDRYESSVHYTTISTQRRVHTQHECHIQYMKVCQLNSTDFYVGTCWYGLVFQFTFQATDAGKVQKESKLAADLEKVHIIHVHVYIYTCTCTCS